MLRNVFIKLHLRPKIKNMLNNVQYKFIVCISLMTKIIFTTKLNTIINFTNNYTIDKKL